MLHDKLSLIQSYPVLLQLKELYGIGV
jgi:hypothetical protein